MSRRAMVACALGTLLLAAACSSGTTKGSSSSNASTGATTGGHLTLGIVSYPPDMNPLSPTVDAVSLNVMNSWFQYLVEPSPDGSTFVPTLASSYTVSPDHMTYTFVVRSGVRWSDGSPMTTSDVVESLKNAFDQKTSQINFLQPKIASISAAGNNVVIKMKSPWAYLLNDLSGFNAAIMPYKLIQQEGYSNFLKHPIGTGPFKWTSAVPGSSITVTRNSHYWQSGLPYLNSITFSVIPADVARATAVEGGQADVVPDPPLNQVSALKANPNLRVLTFPSSFVMTVVTNVKKPPLDNESLREAISLAVDRAAIVKTGLFGAGTPATTFIVPPPSQTFQNPALNLYVYNPTKARQILQQSGLKQPINLSLIVSQGSAQDAIAAVMQQDLQAIGIRVSIIRQDLVTSKSNINTGNYMMGTTIWSDYIGDPSIQVLFWVDPAYCCNAFFTNYDNPSNIATAHAAVNASPSQAKTLFDQVQQNLAVSAHAIPLYYPYFVYVTTSHVTGFKIDPFGTIEYATLGFTK
jgi:peptide/nickel transport system substrate-binding protein